MQLPGTEALRRLFYFSGSKFFDLSNESWAKLRISLFT